MRKRSRIHIRYKANAKSEEKFPFFPQKKKGTADYELSSNIDQFKVNRRNLEVL